MNYQLGSNDQPIENQTNSLLQSPTAAVRLAGDYTVAASNAVGVVTTVTETRDPAMFVKTQDALNATDDIVNLRLTGLAGARPVVLYASTIATHWEAIPTNPPAVGTLDFADHAFTNKAVRFYQSVEGL